MLAPQMHTNISRILQDPHAIYIITQIHMDTNKQQLYQSIQTMPGVYMPMFPEDFFVSECKTLSYAPLHREHWHQKE